MIKRTLALGIGAALLTTTGCSNDNREGGEGGPAQSPAAQEAAGNQTIASGLPANSQFLAAAKAAGLDQTLAGPGPYTVLVPADAAFAAAPAGSLAATPENRAQLTGVLTHLILPGTVLAEDIGKAIDAGDGKAVLATMGGGTLTATREGDKIVLADASGTKATVTQADQKFSNGVVHQVSAVLMPAQQAAAGAQPAPAGQAQ